jgi:hypothetical protein
MNKKILEYLLENPGWHYGLGLVKAGVGSRGTIYVGLGRLVEAGYVEMRDSPDGPPPYGGPPRPQFRATRKGLTDIGTHFGGVPA